MFPLQKSSAFVLFLRELCFCKVPEIKFLNTNLYFLRQPIYGIYVRLEVSVAVKIHVGVFLVVMPRIVAAGCHFFRGPCCLPLQGEVNGGGVGGMDIGKEY
jgi:hypothetical protein